MNLHKNRQEFYDTLLALGDRLNTSPAIIEKDYYVTMFLEALKEDLSLLFFPEDLRNAIIAEKENEK